jgi:hypothetical protein
MAVPAFIRGLIAAASTWELGRPDPTMTQSRAGRFVLLCLRQA